MSRFDYEFGKRIVDLALAVPALILSAPLQLGVAAAVRIKLGRPVLFRQVRPGRHGEPFGLLKFRTMRPIDLTRGWSDDASRLTPFGTTLRSWSLDELPALWNVVRGDLSLVGPRPLLPQYLPRYTTEQARRHDVKPGLTGLSQVSGRNSVDWDERLRLDVDYVNRRSLRLDAKILVATAAAVLRRDGINANGHATMPEFMGTGSAATP